MRKFESPGSIDRARNCARAYAYHYIERIREPECEWDDMDAPRGRRKKALGKEGHARLERYYLTGEASKADFPGQIVASGLPRLPRRDRVEAPRIEQEIGSTRILDHEHASRALWVAPGFYLNAKADFMCGGLVVSEATRLGLRHDLPLVVDYKFTSSLRWAKSPEVLRDDLAANAYAADACDRFDAPAAQCRWVYFETADIRRAYHVDFVIERNAAAARLCRETEFVHRMSAIESADTALLPCEIARNRSGRWYRTDGVDPCLAYGGLRGGGCYYLQSNGGPCDVWFPPGRLCVHIERNRKRMALPSNLKAQAAAAGATATETDDETDAPELPEEAAPKRRSRGRPSSAKKSEPVTDADPIDTAMARVVAARAELAAASAALKELL